MQSSLPRGYVAVRAKYPDTILFFEIGDAVECYDRDARKVSEILGQPTWHFALQHEAIGFPRMRLEEYLPALVKHSKVAVCRPLSKVEAEEFRKANGVAESLPQHEYQLTLF